MNPTIDAVRRRPLHAPAEAPQKAPDGLDLSHLPWESDTTEAAEKAGGTPRQRRRPSPRGASSSITPPQSSHTPRESPHAGLLGEWDPDGWKGARDWLDFGALIDWDRTPEAAEARQVVTAAQTIARENRRPEPIALPGVTVYVHGRGSKGGNARDSYMQFVLSFGPQCGRSTGSRACRLELSFDDRSDRGLYGLRGSFTGTSWATYGESVWALFNVIMRFLGGYASDMWPRRVDYRLDLLGLPMQRLVDLYEAECFTATSKHHARYSEGHDRTGFTIGGRSSKAPRTVVYDKARDLRNASPAYLVGLLESWGIPAGELDVDPAELIPTHAPRIEYCIRKGFTDKYGIKDLRTLQDQEAELFAKLTGAEGSTYAPFRFTAGRPDRRNKHQSRARTHPIMDQIRYAGSRCFGRPAGSLTPISPTPLEPDKALRVAASLILGAEAKHGRIYETREEFIAAAARALSRGDFDDEFVSRKSWDGAERAGVADILTSFDPAELEPAPRRRSRVTDARRGKATPKEASQLERRPRPRQEGAAGSVPCPDPAEASPPRLAGQRGAAAGGDLIPVGRPPF